MTKRNTGLLDKTVVLSLLCVVAMFAWMCLGTSISNMFTSFTTTICTPSRRQLILVPRPYPPGFEPVLVLPEPPRGWHYRPDDRLETDAQ